MRRYTDEELDDLDYAPRLTRCTCNSQSLQPCAYCERDREDHEAVSDD